MDETMRGETSPLPPEAPVDDNDVRPSVAGGPKRRVRGATTHTDPLTGALARAALDREFAAVRRRTASVGLLLIDVDHFKSINDAFGHAAGDAVLREFGVRARTTLRGGDLLIRYGGDEFVVILPNAKVAAAHEVAARLLASVSSRPFPGTPPLTVTLSIGCAVADAVPPAPSLAALLEQADVHLYEAKRRGRNQVVSATEARQIGGPPVEAADDEGRLIERESAFAQMLAWLDGLQEAERGLLRVLAVPGSGLTRFLGAVEDMARLHGYRILALAGSPALRLRRYGALEEAQHGTGDGEPHDRLQLLTWTQQAEDAGVLVILDRAGEIDVATLELLWQVIAHPSVRCVGLVVGLSPEAEMVRLPDLSLRAEVRLQPFSPAALQVWLRGVLHWEAPPELGAWLYAQTDGYPAHLQAAVRQMATEGMLARRRDEVGWQVSPFIEEYPLRDWLLTMRAGKEKLGGLVRPYGLLIGRSTELRALTHAPAAQRVVVLSGHGGGGKTHLALQAAAELGSRYADGVTVVHLAALTAVEFVPTALVRALGLAISGRQDPLDIALEYLATREMLVVFDNAEHLPEIGTLVRDLVAACARVRMLITTRDATIIPADVVLTLKGVTEGSALFLQESDLPAPDAVPTEEEMAAIERICRQVQGYPLAIKMLASWTSLFSPSEIANRLIEHALGRTTGESANERETDGSPMHTVFDVFWTMLSERDRQCIGGLALFRGGFTATAAFDVADVTPFLLAALRDRAFVQTATAGRYHLHELVRQYAWARLQGDTVATATIQRRHAIWYAGQAAASATDMRGPRFRQWVERLETEMDNLRLALTWALDHAPRQALQAATDLTEFWLAGTYPSEGHRWIDTALARAEEGPDLLPPSMRMRALGRLGRLERQWGDTGAARLHLTTAVSLAEGEIPDRDRELAYSLGTLANIESDVGAHEPAVSLARRALDHARRVGSSHYFAETSSMAVWPFVFAGAFEEAAAAAEEGLRASIECGDHRSTANLTNAKATIAYYDPSRREEAIGLYQQVIDLYEELRDWSGLLLAFNNLADAYITSNQFDLAAHAYAEARRIGRRVRQHRMMSSVLSGSGIVASVRGDDTAAWGFWREALNLAITANNLLVIEECLAGLAYVWARAGFAAQAAVLLGVIGLKPVGKPWLLPPLERACAATRPAIDPEQWEALLAHGSALDLSTTARLLPALSGPYDMPPSILPAAENLS